MWLFLAPAFASTVAVLPLEQGAGGDAYDGLGIALAGMLVTDLSNAPGLQLVERQRLDAVMDELALGKSAFLDPSTAQRLGRGVGAQYVVTGSYSVVEGQFLLDARLVGVDSAKVIRAADAHGPVDQFVDVEKTLVGGLLVGLDVVLAADAQSRLASAAPTRSFRAFRSYGEGLARQDAGDLEAARAAYAEALTVDPAMVAAANALASLRRELDDRAAARLRAKQQARAEVVDRVLRKFGVPIGASDQRALAGFALRLMAQREAGRDCERYAEMRRYLQNVGYRIGYPKAGAEKFHDEILRVAEETGYSTGVSRFEDQAVTSVRLFADTGAWLWTYPGIVQIVPTAPDLVTALSACLSTPERVGALAELRAGLEQNGVAGVPWGDGKHLTLGERAQWSEVAAIARWTGVDAALATRLRGLIDAQAGEVQAWAEKEGQAVVQLGEQTAREKAQALRFREGEVDSIVQALAKGDTTKVRTSPKLCATEVARVKGTAQVAATQPRRPSDNPLYAPLRDFGCVAGQEGRFTTAEQALAFVASAGKRARPGASDTCTRAIAGAPTVAAPGQDPGNALTWYYATLVFGLCVVE